MMEDEKCQINILTSSKKYSIKTTTLEEATAWTQAINQEVFGPPLPGVIYRFRVRTDRSHLCKGVMADYLLKVYDDKIELYTSNGKILTDFSCDLNKIHRMKYLSTKLHKASNEYLSITTKDAHSNYQEKEILVIQAKSPLDLYKVINHRKRVLKDECSEKLGSSTTTVERSLMSAYQKIPSSKSTSHVVGRAHANIHTLHPNRSVEEEFRAKANTISPGTRPQQKMSDAIMDKVKKPDPLVKHYDGEDQSILNTSRSLQDISYCNHPSGGLGTHFNSDSDVAARTTSVTSPLYANLPIQAPLTKNAVMAKVPHDTTTRHNSTLSLGTTTEEIYEQVYDLASPKYYTVPAGTYPITIGDDGDSNEDDGLYVIDHIDQYLEILPDHDCDKHLYESITGTTAKLNFNKDDCVYDYVPNNALRINHNT